MNNPIQIVYQSYLKSFILFRFFRPSADRKSLEFLSRSKKFGVPPSGCFFVKSVALDSAGRKENKKKRVNTPNRYRLTSPYNAQSMATSDQIIGKFPSINGLFPQSLCQTAGLLVWRTTSTPPRNPLFSLILIKNSHFWIGNLSFCHS